MTDKRHGSPGSHPHADRPNWKPAETIDEYFQNCRDGLEKFSNRKAAKLLGWSRIRLHRAKASSRIPRDLFEMLITQRPGPGMRELANIGALFEGKSPPIEDSCCPNCGYLLRMRTGIYARCLDIIEAWRGGGPPG
jgi:hypothetical protein